MSSPFSRSLRALESERSRGWRTAAVGVLLLIGWVSWFLLARVPLYETSTLARLEATAAAHPVDARMLGRVVSVNLAVGRVVRAGDVLVELESDGERLALGEARRRVEALGPQIAAVRQEIVAEEEAVQADRRASLTARDELGRRCGKRKPCWELPIRRRASSRGCALTASSPRSRTRELAPTPSGGRPRSMRRPPRSPASTATSARAKATGAYASSGCASRSPSSKATTPPRSRRPRDPRYRGRTARPPRPD